MALILWLMQASRITPKAITRHKITLELSQIQTLPPKPPGARPTPNVPPLPKPAPRPKPRPGPRPVKPQKPLPETRSLPAPKKTETPREPKRKTAKGDARQSPVVAEANLTKIKSDTNASKKVIVMRITPKKRKARPEKPKEIKKAPKKRIVRQAPKTAPKKTPKPKQKIVRRRASSRPTPRGPDRRLIHSLYGSSYARMSATQRRFIDENLRRILQISQRTLNYLGYPQEAAHFREQGTNIVEFWLHPNGDISGLRLRRRLRSVSLNRQTLEVIKTAYMYYPRPKVKTKIIIYVKYRLY